MPEVRAEAAIAISGQHLDFRSTKVACDRHIQMPVGIEVAKSKALWNFPGGGREHAPGKAPVAVPEQDDHFCLQTVRECQIHFLVAIEVARHQSAWRASLVVGASKMQGPL